LTELNVRNGHNENFCRVYEYYIHCKNNPSLTCVSVDDVEYAESHWPDCFDLGISFSTNCNPDPLVIEQVVASDVEGCFGDSTGQIIIVATGGEGTLQYSLDNGFSYQVSDTLKSLPAGTYTIVVKDEAGDSLIWESNPVIINQPESLAYSISRTHPQCIGSGSGEIRFAGVSGGTLPYAYSIDGGLHWDTQATFSDLYEGEYEVRVRDSNLCVQDYPPNPILLNDPVHDTIRFVSVQNVEGCFGDSTGIIVINGDLPGSAPLKSAEGVLIYSYSIDGGTTWQSSTLFENLPVGEYTVMIGVAGCEYPYFNNPVIVENVTDISFSVEYFHPVCYGDNKGEIRFINTTGGTSPYRYSIDGGNSWAETDTFRTLSAGSYSLYVRDNNECLKSYNDNPVVLSNPQDFVISSVVAVDNKRCDGLGNGTITITAGMEAGSFLKSVYATAPRYDYSINGGLTWVNTNYRFTGIMGGEYEVWARSDKGCLAEWENNPVVLADTNEVVIYNTIVSDDTGTSDGQIIATVKGGMVPYTYRLDEGSWQETNLFTGLATGTYLLQVTDQYSCSNSQEVAVGDASVPELDTIKGTNFEYGDTLCFGARQTIVVGGNIEADSVRFEPGSSTRLIAGGSVIFLPGVHVKAGSSLLAMITSEGSFCEVGGGNILELPEIQIKSMDELAKSVDNSKLSRFKVYPNPGNGKFVVETTGMDLPLEVLIFNAQGAKVHRQVLNQTMNTIDLQGMQKGVYFLKTLGTSENVSKKLMIR